MLTARETTLRADKAYIDLMEAESTFPLRYVFNNTQPVNPRRTPMWADVPGVPACAIDTYTKLLPYHYRLQHRASQNRPQTELFGRAPYRAQGRGDLEHIDASNRMRFANRIPDRASRIFTEEVELDRFEFVTVPKLLRDLPFDSRMGRMTRSAPGYVQPQPHQ